MDLFTATDQPQSQPLAYRMRPRTLDEFVGQDHIVGDGRLLRRAIQADQLTSVIFYGPPGTGKTTLARVIANTTRSSFVTLNAVLSGVKQLREEIEAARERLSLHGHRTILFIDEVHRWNKAQQDALLPWVENGTVILIGATTENPYFEVNPALVSRSRIFQLIPLTAKDLERVAQQALHDPVRGYGRFTIAFETGALEHIIDIANGDARSLLNALELAIETSPEVFPPSDDRPIEVSLKAAEESIQKKIVLYDKEGDYHFDVISAFIKSLRGSDPDAALYWLARMVRAGEDPKYIFRRLLISASEDIGMADPNALGVVVAAAEAFDRVGMPEGRFHLTQATLYLATAEKSNSSMGFFDALASVEREADSTVPNHLKDSSRDKEGFGHGEGYLYPHAYRDHWVAQQYLPEGLQGRILYHPSDQGFERSIRESVERRREVQLEDLGTSRRRPVDILTTSPPDSERDRWIRRMTSGFGNRLADIRDTLFRDELLAIQRHSRILVLNAGKGILVWEALRRVPEGGVTALVDAGEDRSIMQHHASNLHDLDRPEILMGPQITLLSDISTTRKYEFVVGLNSLTRSDEQSVTLEHLLRLVVPGGSIHLCETIPRLSSRLSTVYSSLCSDPDARLITTLIKAERLLYDESDNPLVNWDAASLEDLLSRIGFTQVHTRLKNYTEQRSMSKEDITRWIEKSYRPLMVPEPTLPEVPPAQEMIDVLSTYLVGHPVPWVSTVCFVSAISPAR